MNHVLTKKNFKFHLFVFFLYGYVFSNNLSAATQYSPDKETPFIEFQPLIISQNSGNTIDIVKEIISENRLNAAQKPEKEFSLPPRNTTSSSNDFENPIFGTKNHLNLIAVRIRQNIIYSENIDKNTTPTEIEIRIRPNGDIYQKKILAHSNSTAWDTAVLNALDKTARVPKSRDGKVPEIMIIKFNPHDQ